MSQLSLPLNFPEISHDQPLLPVRMVNEFVYCARLAYLEWVQGEWRESLDTVQGTHAHRRVDQARGNLPVLDPQTGLEPCGRHWARVMPSRRSTSVCIQPSLRPWRVR